jgi:hypothetical protein
MRYSRDRIQKPEARSQKPEVRSKKQEARSQKPEARSKKDAPLRNVFFWLLTIASGPFWLLASDSRQLPNEAA